MSLKSVEITPELAAYCLDASMVEHPVLAALRTETAALPLAVMQIDPTYGQFLSFLVKTLNAKRTLDIGVFTGYSALAVALALPPAGQVVACDTNEEWTRIAEQYWVKAGVKDRIQLALAPAIETLDKLLGQGQDGCFDFAFIDADKANYDHYYERSLRLLREGGIIALDNMLDQGKVAMPEVQTARVNRFRDLTRKIRDDARVDASLLPVGDGILLARKREMNS